MEALTAVALELHERKGSLTKTERRTYLWARCSLAVLFSIRADARNDWSEPSMLQNPRSVVEGDSASADAHLLAVRFQRGRWKSAGAVTTTRGTRSVQIGSQGDGRLDVPPGRPVPGREAGEGIEDLEVPELRAVGY